MSTSKLQAGIIFPGSRINPSASVSTTLLGVTIEVMRK